MRNYVLTNLMMLCGVLLGLVSFSAHATIIHVGFANAGGTTSWTSKPIGDPHGTVTLSGWEYDNGWTPATMFYKKSGGAENGMGLTCNQNPTNNRCSQHEIGATPWQMIDMNISNLTNWNALTLNLGSINGTTYGSGGGTNGDETGYLLGAQCSVDGNCASIVLASCTNYGTSGSQTCAFTFTKQYLLNLGITDIWVTPSKTNPDGTNNANILFGSGFDLHYVPEPAELGMFGFGILLIGLFLGLRRRQTI
ncbi:PEP-CTERM sorting domain-containing protein [Oleiagrimonas sp.]|uniref:PEP-CTERM sorting domain-containing protein n=1 Tax=Oleiagrimonas sp. TaxID=2010330 RepID=UPI00260B2D1A|nr:PEP-CTERM sorting domain-containing protein [Oleiagrimonas sp.]MDA3913857.1 PEP-CTERM sorting domain-containing protein [Oleiagrimonas sp.]